MSISAAPYETSLPALAGSFAPCASRTFGESRIMDMFQDQDRTGETQDHGALALNPPRDTPGEHLRHITRLLNRYDTVGALDRIVRLLDRGPDVEPDMQMKLRYLADLGMTTLKENGMKTEAAYYALRLQLADPEPKPILPPPQPRFFMSSPAFAGA